MIFSLKVHLSRYRPTYEIFKWINVFWKLKKYFISSYSRGWWRNSTNDQRASRHKDSTHSTRGWRRHSVHQFPRWSGQVENARLMYELPQLCRHFEEWRSKHAPVLYTGGNVALCGIYCCNVVMCYLLL